MQAVHTCSDCIGLGLIVTFAPHDVAQADEDVHSHDRPSLTLAEIGTKLARLDLKRAPIR
jgi:hypothetical protein